MTSGSWAMTAESSQLTTAARVMTSGSWVVMAETSIPALAMKVLAG